MPKIYSKRKRNISNKNKYKGKRGGFGEEEKQEQEQEQEQEREQEQKQVTDSGKIDESIKTDSEEGVDEKEKKQRRHDEAVQQKLNDNMEKMPKKNAATKYQRFKIGLKNFWFRIKQPFTRKKKHKFTKRRGEKS